MKHNVIKKLYSRRGATMLIAILVFLIAVLSGTIALTMAASNAGRYTHEKDDQQAYLSVASAANIILDRLTGIEIVCSASGGHPEPEQVTVSYNIEEGKKDDLFLKDSGFKNILKFYSTGKGSAPTLEFTLTAEGAPAMGEVYVNLSISGGTFYFHLYSADGGHRDYQMTMRVETKFTFGDGNFVEETTGSGKYIRKMYFDTKNATYTVEEDVSSGGTTE